MRLVAGVDSSTLGCKVVVCDADTGAVRRHGNAPHPAGTEIDPEHWRTALEDAGIKLASVASQTLSKSGQRPPRAPRATPRRTHPPTPLTTVRLPGRTLTAR